MDDFNVMEVFENHEAIQRGHFILSSGLRSEFFIQKMKVFQDTYVVQDLCDELRIKVYAAIKDRITAVVSPAIGAMIPGYEMAKEMDYRRFMFTERENGVMKLRRGFKVYDTDQILIVEDIVTTGASVTDTIKAIHDVNPLAKILGIACIIDRSNGFSIPGVPLISLGQISFPTFSPDKIPEHLKNIPAVKPGSNF